MHKDVIKINSEQIIKPDGEINIVYFSSSSNNTARFVEKLKFHCHRIPYELNKTIIINTDYVLFCPTYSGGGEDTKNAIPKQVIKFLNNPQNRSFCRGVISSGNTNFGNTFAIAGPILSKKLNVPLLYQFELIGNIYDVEKVIKILKNFWKKEIY